MEQETSHQVGRLVSCASMLYRREKGIRLVVVVVYSTTLFQ
jgi:hypothetical protein